AEIDDWQVVYVERLFRRLLDRQRCDGNRNLVLARRHLRRRDPADRLVAIDPDAGADIVHAEFLSDANCRSAIILDCVAARRRKGMDRSRPQTSRRGGMAKKACTTCHSWWRLWPNTSACAAPGNTTTWRS